LFEKWIAAMPTLNEEEMSWLHKNKKLVVGSKPLEIHQGGIVTG